MAQSAFIVKVPGVESLVGRLRERFDATSGLGVPAHITVLFPFMDPADITADVLQRAGRALERINAFSFTLDSVGRFPSTAYLAPNPCEPFIAMTRAIADAFPGFEPHGGEHRDVVPHLTAAHGNRAEADAAEEELRRRLDEVARTVQPCDSVSLIENSTGRWQEFYAFQLSSSGGAT